jgi:uncharacterized protein DUF3892
MVRVGLRRRSRSSPAFVRVVYYTDEDYGPRAYLEVVEAGPFGGPSYVRTKADCTTANNLLSLPRI